MTNFNLDEKGIKRAKIRKRVFIDLLTLKKKNTPKPKFQIPYHHYHHYHHIPHRVPRVCFVSVSIPLFFFSLSCFIFISGIIILARLCYVIPLCTSYIPILCLIDSCEPSINIGVIHHR